MKRFIYLLLFVGLVLLALSFYTFFHPPRAEGQAATLQVNRGAQTSAPQAAAVTGVTSINGSTVAAHQIQAVAPLTVSTNTATGVTLITYTGGGGGGAPANPFVITNGTNSLTFNVPTTGNPVISSTSGGVDLASLFVTNLAGTGVSCLQADALGNVTRSGAACGTGGGGGGTNNWADLLPGTLALGGSNYFWVGGSNVIAPLTTGTGRVYANYLSSAPAAGGINPAVPAMTSSVNGYLHWTGTTLAWDTPTGGGGPTTSLPLSSITGATANAVSISHGPYDIQWGWDYTAPTANTNTGLQLWDAMPGTTVAANVAVLSLYTDNLTVNPLDVVTNANNTHPGGQGGFFVDGTSGDINMYPNSKVIGRMQLMNSTGTAPVASSSMLSTDAGGNVVGSTAPGIGLATNQVLWGGGAGNPPVGTTVNSGGFPCMTTTGPSSTNITGDRAVIINLGGGQCPAGSFFTLNASNYTFYDSAAGGAVTLRTNSDSTVRASIFGFLFKQGDMTGTNQGGVNSSALVIRGANNSAYWTNVGNMTRSGSLGLFGGAATLTSGVSVTVRPASNGFVQVGQGFYVSLSAAAPTPFNLVCAEGTTEQTVVDCPATPAYIIGVAQVVGPVGVTVIEEGEVPINCPGSCTLGHTVCAGATAGQVTDSGGTGACTTGFLLGVVNRVANTYTLPGNTSTTSADGPSVTFSSTLPSIILLGRK